VITELASLVLGMALLAYCSHRGVDHAVHLAAAFGVPTMVIGLLVVSVGTDLPEIAAEALKLLPSFKAPGRFMVFKRWDLLSESDEPEVVIFFASPDVLSGLFTLANFEVTEPNAVFTPWGSGCSSIVTYPFLEKDSIHPRAVIGLFDVSPRSLIPQNILSFSVPMLKFERMVHNMKESFLTTNSWKRVQKRIQGGP